jgi:ankyrin repeat protein
VKNSDSSRLASLLQPDPRQNPATRPAGGQTLLATAIAATQPSMDVLNQLVAAQPQTVTLPDASGDTPLTLAARQGNLDVLNVLLGAKTDLKLDQFGPAIMIAAVQGGHIPAVDLLNEKKVNVNAADDEHRTPLQVAAGQHDGAMVAELLKLGAIPDAAALAAADTEPASPPVSRQIATALLLHVAASADKPPTADLMAQLLKDNADVMATAGGQTALQIAAGDGNAAVVRAMLGWPSIPESAWDDIRKSAAPAHPEIAQFIDNRWNSELFSAIALGNNQRVHDLLGARPGPGPTTRPDDGATALAVALAVSPPNRQVVQTILDSEPGSLDVPNTAGDTPLWAAVRSGNVDAVDMLADKMDPKTVNQTDTVGDRLLNLAVQSGKPELVKSLVSHLKLSLTSADGKQNTPLRLAAQAHDVAMIAALMDLGAQPEMQDMTDVKNTQPMDVAAGNAAHLLAENILVTLIQSNSVDQIKQLLDLARQCKLDVPDLLNRPDAQGQTPLQLAAAGPNNTNLVALLIDNGASVNMANPQTGDTALHVAAGAGCDAIVHELIDNYHANADLLNRRGLTAQQLAQNDGHAATANIFGNAAPPAGPNLVAPPAAPAASPAFAWYKDIHDHHRRLVLASVGAVDFNLIPGSPTDDVRIGDRQISPVCDVAGTFTFTIAGAPLPGLGDGVVTRQTVIAQGGFAGIVTIRTPQTRLIHTYSGVLEPQPDGSFAWRIGNLSVPATVDHNPNPGGE